MRCPFSPILRIVGVLAFLGWLPVLRAGKVRLYNGTGAPVGILLAGREELLAEIQPYLFHELVLDEGSLERTYTLCSADRARQCQLTHSHGPGGDGSGDRLEAGPQGELSGAHLMGPDRVPAYSLIRFLASGELPPMELDSLTPAEPAAEDPTRGGQQAGAGSRAGAGAQPDRSLQRPAPFKRDRRQPEGGEGSPLSLAPAGAKRQRTAGLEGPSADPGSSVDPTTAAAQVTYGTTVCPHCGGTFRFQEAHRVMWVACPYERCGKPVDLASLSGPQGASEVSPAPTPRSSSVWRGRRGRRGRASQRQRDRDGRWVSNHPSVAGAGDPGASGQGAGQQPIPAPATGPGHELERSAATLARTHPAERQTPSAPPRWTPSPLPGEEPGPQASAPAALPGSGLPSLTPGTERVLAEHWMLVEPLLQLNSLALLQGVPPPIDPGLLSQYLELLGTCSGGVPQTGSMGLGLQ